MITATDIGLPKDFFDYSSLGTGTCKIIRQFWRDKYGDNCLFCETKMIFSINKKKKIPKNYATIDHINSRALGGTNSLDNIQVICASCNAKKSVLETLVIQGIY